MAGKIEKYRMGDKCLELSVQPGMTSGKIAEILTKDLDGADTISQPTVSRFLKTTREDRSEQTKILIQKGLEGMVPKDLEVLEEVESFFLCIFRGNPADENEKHTFMKDDETPYEFDLTTRAQAGKDAAEIVMKKFRLAGAEDASPNREREKETDERLFDKARSGISGIVRGLRAAGVSGPKPKQGLKDTQGSSGVRA